MTEVVKTGPGDSEVVTTTTTKEADRSLLERSLAAGGLLLVRIGVVALAAFLAGAVVQRTLLGNFALKLGPLEIPELKRAAEESERALGEIQSQLKTQTEATEEAMSVAADAADAVSSVATDVEALTAALGTLLDLAGDGGEKEGVDVDVDLEGDESEEQQ